MVMTISVLSRLHFVCINTLRALGIHALNAFLSYNILCELHTSLQISHNIIVTVGNNVNRHDVASIRCARSYCRERCTFQLFLAHGIPSVFS